jgi:hyperosmotically inducible protein
MKGFFLGLIVGILIAGAVVWYYADQRKNPTAQAARDGIQSSATEAKGLAQDRLNSMGLTSDNIKEELARTGKVVRRKSEDAGSAIADATADARATAVIKGKFLADPDLSALSISVNTTAGHVTLSGSASSPENIRKAILLAMDTNGVREVVSTLQVK